LLNIPTLCSIPLKLSVVAATGPDSCRRPDPTTVLCGEQSTMLTPTETGATMFTVPMPPGCRVEDDAFLKLEFPSLPDACSELAQRPRLVTSDHCSACEVYNIYSFGNDDLCALQFPGQPIMYSTVETCAVPTLTRSWGSLKILYR
jgi:hypothetical protein